MAESIAEKLLVVSQSSVSAQTIRHAVGAGSDRKMIYAPSVTRAKQKLRQERFDIVIVVTPLADEFGADFALGLAEKQDAGVILMVRSEIFDQVLARTQETGVIVLSKRADRTALLQAVGVLIPLQRRIRMLSEENSRLRRRLDDLSTVTQAKCLLIEKEHMTEAEAHHFLQKRAMDTFATMRSVAEDILRDYGPDEE